jgi:MFS family permease
MKYHLAHMKSHAIYTIAIIGFIYTFHLVIPTYSNSSFLNLFVSEKTIGVIYMMGSLVTIIGFILIPYVLRKVGNYAVTLCLIFIQIFLFYGLVTASNPFYIATFFIFQMAVVAFIGFCFDIFLEVYSDKAHVGVIRGMYLTTMNCAWVIAPLIGSLIIGASNDYRSVYTASLFILFPLFYLVHRNFPRFKDPHYHHPSPFHTMALLLRDKNHSLLFIINIILQTFYAWMVVYSIIYLNTVIGLSWSEIGIILTVMLIPFAVLQWPLGKLADRKYGEKEIMMISFALLGLATIILSAITSKSVFVWALALFLTRVGAAGAEVMIETYFFKTVNVRDPNLLGFFRITRSISFFIAPLITGIVLIFTENQSSQFIALGLLCLCALVPIWRLKDTR